MNEPLHLDAVAKTLAGRAVLDDVTFTVPPCSITALLGPNGAGKTTVVTLAAGLRVPDAGGSVQVFGADPVTAAGRRGISVVPQDIAFPREVRVGRCLDFVEQQRAPSPWATPRDEIVGRLGLGQVQGRPTGALSGGQRRRLAVAMALLRCPGLLVLDEATTNLDESGRLATWALVRDYAALGGAVLVTSHILADIEAHADRVVALHEGRVVLDQALTEVRSDLGGSRVTLRADAMDSVALVQAVAGSGLGTADPTLAAGTVSWRSPRPAALVALVVRAAARLGLTEPTDLTVAPVPLSDLLAGLSSRATDEVR